MRKEPSIETLLMLLCLTSGPLIAQQDAKVTPLMSKDPTDFPGKEGLMITVEYPSGASDPIHRDAGRRWKICHPDTRTDLL